MENNKSTLDLATALVPILRYLTKRGVLSVHSNGAYILLREDVFREIWPDAQPDSRGELSAEYDGQYFVAETGAGKVAANG